MGRILALLLLIVMVPGAARAETSSWTSKNESADTTRRAPVAGKPQKPVSTAKSPAAQPPSAPPPAPGNDGASNHAKGAPDIEDAAYEAFDQGRYLTALELAVKASETGDPQAHTLVGRIYGEGYGVAKNSALAAKWYARGAELGDPESMFAYAMMLADGQGVDKDHAAAAGYFEAAAMHKHPMANYNLALLFLKGDGKPENPYRGFMHMQFAAEAGVTAAQYDLGTLYATGTGVAPNAFEAAKWIGKAAAAGHPEAALDFGVLLFRGHGVPVDEKRGADMFRLAAEKGLASAQDRLARCYVYGAGVERNLVEGIKWYLIAKAGGIEDDGLEKVLAGLSSADRSKAQKAASDWRERAQVGIE
ncbi:MAG TPA: SEL1-like repeat protein [Hyphomicrobiaceae bacterium]|nr:SEL1-like repeat protein [Hyphomicrobiaceae bacterium]